MPLTLAYLNFFSGNGSHYFDSFIRHNIGEVHIVRPSAQPDILICSCFGSIQAARQTPAKCKFFYYGENLDRYPPYNNRALLGETFDLIIGFRETNPQTKEVRFPLWLLYYPYYAFYAANNLLTHVRQARAKNMSIEKSRFATVVSKHDRDGRKRRIIRALEAHGPTSYGGKFKNNVRIGRGVAAKIKFLAEGYFNICPENSRFPGYCTEKIFHALEAGTIPLYWGNSVPESKLLNPRAYCFCELNGREDEPLFDQIRHVVEDRDEYLAQDPFLPDAESTLDAFYKGLHTAMEDCLKSKL